MDNILSQYGVTIMVLTFISLVLTGVAKTPLKAKLNKMTDSSLKKYSGAIYLILSFTIPCIIVLAYLYLYKNISASNFTTTYGLVTGCMQLMYPMYEKLGGRKLFLFIVSVLIKKGVDDVAIKIENSTFTLDRALDTVCFETQIPKRYLVNYINTVSKKK